VRTGTAVTAFASTAQIATDLGQFGWDPYHHRTSLESWHPCPFIARSVDHPFSPFPFACLDHPLDPFLRHLQVVGFQFTRHSYLNSLLMFINYIS